MALQFGNTTRLHHIDFSSASTESGAQICDQAGLQEEMKPIAAQERLHKTGKVNLKIRTKQEKEMKSKPRQERSAQSLSSARIKTEIVNNGGSCDATQEGHPNRSTFGTLTQQAATRYVNLTVEWDVLDSFSEFATFLEVQNPICPAHLIDTPEKLLNVLSCEL